MHSEPHVVQQVAHFMELSASWHVASTFWSIAVHFVAASAGVTPG